MLLRAEAEDRYLVRYQYKCIVDGLCLLVSIMVIDDIGHFEPIACGNLVIPRAVGILLPLWFRLCPNIYVALLCCVLPYVSYVSYVRYQVP